MIPEAMDGGGSGYEPQARDLPAAGDRQNRVEHRQDRVNVGSAGGIPQNAGEGEPTSRVDALTGVRRKVLQVIPTPLNCPKSPLSFSACTGVPRSQENASSY